MDLRLLGEKLREAREEMKYTQQYVAEFVGKTREQISYYETGKREISISLLSRLANLYGKSLEYFFGDLDAEPRMEVAYRSGSIFPEDREKIEWAKNFVNNLYELKRFMD